MTSGILNAFTVDVEDWFTSSYELFKVRIDTNDWVPPSSVLKNTLLMLDIIDEAEIQGTFFVLGIVARHYPRIVKEMVRRGHEVASHTYSHRLLYDLSEKQVRDEIGSSIKLLQDLSGKKILGMRAPYFSITAQSLWVLDLLSEFGLEYDSSIFPIHRGLYGIPRFDPRPKQLPNGLWEFPISVLNLGSLSLPLGGGGYMRLLPVTYFVKGIRKLNKGGVPAVMYFHPYELDPEDLAIPVDTGLPRLKTKFLLWQQGIGRKGMPRKVKRLLQKHSFTSISNILETWKRESA